MKATPLVFIGALQLASCASAPLPPEVAEIALIGISSAAVEVQKPKFRVNDGGLELEGYVYRQHRADTTADTHLDIVFLDPAGRETAVETTNFNPRSLPKASRLPRPHAYFRVVIVGVPPGTRAIEVRAHDGPHENRPAAP